MKLSHLIGPYPEPMHRNHACPGRLLDRWDSDERKSVHSKSRTATPIDRILRIKLCWTGTSGG
jgi:hypothetical protein